MADLAIGAAIASLKTAGDIAGSFLKVRDQTLIQGKVIELQSAILTAQQNALASQAEQFALIDEKRALATKVADLEAWVAQRERYQLRQLGKGAFVYELKAEAAKDEPPHAICPNCYEQGRRSILQTTGPNRTTGMTHLRCLACDADIKVSLPAERSVRSSFEPVPGWKVV